MNKNPIVLKTKNGHAVLHESGIYFINRNDDLEKCLQEISLRRRPELPIEYTKRERIAKIIIYLSTQCNLRCVYCYASAGENNSVVSIENAKTLISYIADKADRIILDFHGGGEPLLHFDIINELHGFAKRTGKLYRTVLISNGTIHGENNYILNWIVKNVDVMALSCDGYPEIQNQQRPQSDFKASSDLIESTIAFFNNNRYVYTIRSTITREASEHLLDITKYFYSLGVKYLVYSPCYNYGRSDSSSLLPVPSVYGQQYMKSVEFAYKHGMRLTSTSFRYPGYHYCGALSGFNIALTTDNFISSCYEVVSSQDSVSNIFIIGKVADGKVEFFNDKINDLAKFELEIGNTPCNSCSYRLVCRGGCPVKKMRGSDKSLQNLCGITRYLVPKMLNFLEEHPDAASSVLKNIEIDYR